MRKALLPALLLLIASSQLALAEKYRGYIWDKAEGVLLVEGIPVQVSDSTKIERKDTPRTTWCN